MGTTRIIRPLLAGLFAAGILIPARANDAKTDGNVTEKTAVQVQNPQKNDEHLPVDYPSLCRMAESHQDWIAAWGFAEKWAGSGNPEVRREGVRKLLDLSFHRSGVDAEKLVRMAVEAGVPEETVQLFRARTALRQRDFRRAVQLTEKLLAEGNHSKEMLSRLLQLQILAHLGMKDFAEAAEFASRRMAVAADDPERFHAACYRVYALSAAGQQKEAESLLNTLAAAHPEHAGALADLQMFLAAKKADWQDFDQRLSKRGKGAKGSYWYLAACRAAAEFAESRKDHARAVQMRRAVLDASVEDEDRKLAVLHLLAALDGQQAWKEMAGTLQQYLLWYPDTADKHKLQMQAARYLVKAGETGDALKWYDKIIAGEEVSAEHRFAAAMEAADQCCAGNLPEEELKYLESALRHAPTPEARQEACFRQGTYYTRTGAHKRAQEAFQLAAGEAGPLQEKAALHRLQSLIRSRDFKEAIQAAQALSSAEAPDLRAAARYHLASLHEKTGDKARAAREYQEFAREYAKSEFAAPALYNAALIAEEQGNEAEFVRRLEAFLQFAPRHELAPNAAYRKMLSLENIGKTEESAQTGEKLVSDFPGSLFAAAALFHLVDRAAAENRHGAALEYLARIEALPLRNAGIRARVLFDRASIHAKLDNPRKALELLDKLLSSHAADPVAADAAELAGFLSGLLGEYKQGAAFYNRAAQLRPGGVFASGCLERRGDCLFSAASDKEDGELLRQAEAQYRSLLEKGRAYAPLLFKIGRCREAAGDVREAAQIYTEVLYRQAADFRQGVHPDPVWAPKALYAAIRLNRAKRSLEGARNTLRLIDLARQIGLTPGGMDAIEQELQAKYKL